MARPPFDLIAFDGDDTLWHNERLHHAPTDAASMAPAGAKLVEPPARIYLRFNSKLEKRLSRVTLTATAGRPVPLPVAAGDGEKPDRIVLPLGSLRPGAYVIRYKVLAADGHITEGAVRFTVLEPK